LSFVVRCGYELPRFSTSSLPRLFRVLILIFNGETAARTFLADAGFDDESMEFLYFVEVDNLPLHYRVNDRVVTLDNASIPNSEGKIAGLANNDYLGTSEHFIVDFGEAGTCTIHINDMAHIQA